MMLAATRSETPAESIPSVQNLAFTPSLSVGFLPAFRHQESGEVRLCQFSDGSISPIHLIDCLPSRWVRERDAEGRPSALIGAIEAGFLRGADFWSLRDLLHPRLDG
ncbi:hypothetical protein [Imhoffiella purpurea]|uniref:Uncharacterized protein n=1 Tax=Imhoffiella purpurea TaxID=1249627 RepID=W9VBR2_9GAMM|nr:hypothetical protein [Imhoffiella purpurea]EXJ16854.1 hypothetical protein D779_2465 [Imhoffiella purpurea]